MKTNYKVNGMSCGGCANSIIKAITAIEQNSKVEVNLDAKTICVDGQIEEEAVRRAVSEAGFEFGGKVD